MKIFEYTGQSVTVIIKADDLEMAFVDLKIKLEEEEIDLDDVSRADLMEIGSDGELGVIAFIDNRSAFI